MENDNKVRGASIRLSTVATSTRQTPKTDFGTVMRDGLVRAGNMAADGLRVAAPFVPGGAIVSAALAGGTNTAANVGGPSYGSASYGAHGSGFSTASYGLTAPDGGPTGGSVGSIGTGNTLTLPGRRPGLSTDLSGSPTSFSPNAAGTGSATAGSSDAFNNMMSATKQMAEFQASFNLQYLSLQEKIQIDSRQFNLVSNIMKTKHDAAKNALNNVR